MKNASDLLRRYRRPLESLVGIPATEGNTVEALCNGDEIFPAMLEAIQSAEHTIDFLTFVYWTGQIADDFAQALADKASSGVRVRVLLDAIGARLMDAELANLMKKAGVEVEWFRKPTTWKVWETNHRTHRKVLVCDESVAFTGGVGIAQEWCGDARDSDEWRDTHFRVTGPAVDGMRAAFATNWAETGRRLFDERDRFPDQSGDGDACVQVVRGSAGIGWTDMATVFRTLIELAEHRIRLTTAYFAPDERYVELLREASARGVQVDILLPGPHADKRFVQLGAEAEYAQLLEAGVRIWNFQTSMLHAKILTIDGLVSAVGSANFNNRSMTLDEELDLVVLNEDLATELDAHFDQDLEQSVEIDAERWAKRGIAQRVKEKSTEAVDSHM